MSIFNYFRSINLTIDQKQALNKILHFLQSDDEIFILKGYAGTGKTTMLEGIVKYLEEINRHYALMSPTGRAAKVLSDKTGRKASTIHRAIYSYSLLKNIELEEENIEDNEEASSFFYYYQLRNNMENNIIYIVDEASMIADKEGKGEFFRFGSGCLLSDLISFTRIGLTTCNSKIIFIGDPCQLEPVSDSISGALDEKYIQEKFNLSCVISELREVKRQSEKSGILEAATKLRYIQTSGYFNDFDLSDNGHDIFNPLPEHFLDTWESTQGSKVVIAYKNKTCVEINREIRERIYGDGNLHIQRGDIIIMGANNYAKDVFNGEFGVVSDVGDIVKTETISIRNKKGAEPRTLLVKLTWRAVSLIFPDPSEGTKLVTGMALENFLYGDNTLKPEEIRALYVYFKKRFPELKPGTEEFKQALVNDQYFSCLRFKFGYAVTCHKAQGGEWDNVFTIWDYQHNKNKDFFRWAYTAVTRASKKLFAIEPPSFNSYSNMVIMDEQVSNSFKQLTNKSQHLESIECDNLMLQALSKYGLLDQSIKIQDHFIKVRHVVEQHLIEVNGWARRNYEIFYNFKRVENIACIKTFINGNEIFNSRFVKVPSGTNNDDFYYHIVELLTSLPTITIERDRPETILSAFEFEFSVAEQYPFTKVLFDDLSSILEKESIIIEALQHLPFRERYTFTKVGLEMKCDFIYDGKGYFSSVIPIINDKIDINFANIVIGAIKKLKREKNVIS